MCRLDFLEMCNILGIVDNLSPKNIVQFERAIEVIESKGNVPFIINSIWQNGYPARYHIVGLAIKWLYHFKKLECLRIGKDGRCLQWRIKG